jgi:penicillin-binding protein 1B
VWIGRDDNESAELSGAQGALKVWAAAMRKVSRESLELDPPDNVEWIWVDRTSGGRSDKGCANAVRLPFVAGTAPNHSAGCGGGSAPGDSGGSWVKDLF